MLKGEKRLDIKVGFLCNNNCLFCAQANNRSKGNKTTEEIKNDLTEARKECYSVVFTGGEPTLRKDILEIVRCAKQLGFKKIQIQTNGRMVAYKKLCNELIKAGATEFCLALHGHTAELHDSLTRAKGSFKQTVQGIKNLKELRQRVYTNTVVVKANYKFLPDIAELLVSLGVDQYQFALVHPIGNAYINYETVVPRISKVAPYIKRGLDIGIKAGISVMVEAVPYCLMDGYENYIAERIIPDTEIRGIDYFVKDYKEVRVKEGKMKFPQCRKCRYYTVCEGPWKEYPERYGDKEYKIVK